MPTTVMALAGTLLVVCPKSLAGHHMRVARLVNGEGWLDILTDVKPITLTLSGQVPLLIGRVFLPPSTHWHSFCFPTAAPR